MNQQQRIQALELEFERLKERQDLLDRTLQGEPDVWISILHKMPADVAEVTIDKAVAEARQGALAMVTIVRTLASLVDEKASDQETVDPLIAAQQAREGKLRLVQGA